VDISKNHRALLRLRKYCEDAKKILSTSLTAEITIDSLAEDKDFVLELKRSKFEEICECHF